MKLPSESSSSWVLIAFGAFSLSSLNAWSEFTQLPEADRAKLAGMAGELRGSIDALLKEARETQDQQIFGRPEAQAKQNAWLTLLRRTTSEALSVVTNRLGQGSKDHPTVRQFLPKLMASVTNLKLAARPAEVENAAARLAKLPGELAEKPELVQKLNAAAAGAAKAIAANVTAKGAWSRERSEEMLAKAQLRLVLERTHRQLGAQFPGQREFVESFFLKGEKPSEGEDDEDAGDEAPAEG